MSRLGPHAQRTTDAGLRWARRAAIVKQVDGTAILQAAPDWAIRVFRHWWQPSDQDLRREPRAVADTILAALGPYRHPNLYVEVYNEIGKGGRDLYIALLQAVVPLLHAAGVKVCGPSWGTGDFEQADWDAFRAAGWCGLDAIALHAYWADAGLTPWNALRYRTYWRPGQGDPKLLLITECGRDVVRDGPNGTLIGKGGWKRDGISGGVYQGELLRFDAELQRDGEVYATAFTCGPEPEWEPYSADEIDSAPFAGSPGVVPVPIPAPSPTGGSKVSLWLAILPSNQDRNPVVGGTNEQAQMALLAAQVLAESRKHTALSAKVFTGKPESKDSYQFQGLYEQQRAAYAWLNAAPAGTLTVCLNLHTDAGKHSHVGYYYSGGQSSVSYRLAKALGQALARPDLFGGERVDSADYSDYIFAREQRGRNAPVLLEVGSHENAEDTALLKTRGSAVADALVRTILRFFGLAESREGSSPVVAPPKVDLIDDALNGIAHYATQAREAAKRGDAAGMNTALDDQWERFVRLKVALGR